MGNMTTKDFRYFVQLITKEIDKCETIEEVHELNKKIRVDSPGFINDILGNYLDI